VLLCQLQKPIFAANMLFSLLNNLLHVGYIKGGWNLRKAWKIYEKNYSEITELLRVHNMDCIVSTSGSGLWLGCLKFVKYSYSF